MCHIVTFVPGTWREWQPINIKVHVILNSFFIAPGNFRKIDLVLHAVVPYIAFYCAHDLFTAIPPHADLVGAWREL
jgi:hypothetical protein